MIDQVVISGTWLWILALWVGVAFITNIFRILNPHAYTKRVIAGKQKMRDNWERVGGMFGLLLFGTFALYILEIIK